MNPPPKRVLVVGPSWVGDAVMATPALRLLREEWPEARIEVLTRAPVDAVLAGLPFIDSVQVSRPRTLRERHATAESLRRAGFDAALLLSNAFGSALLAAMARIPRRVGYARDGRGWLLTDGLHTPRQGGTLFRPRWALIPAVEYYLNAAAQFIGSEKGSAVGTLELALIDSDKAEGERLLRLAGANRGEAFAVLNPGGNNPAKRWPADRFAALADELYRSHGLKVLVNGSPAESELADEIAANSCGVSLPSLGGTIEGLKAILAQAALVVTNDTGPRHIAAAFGTPVVTLFGPTDHRWTTIPTHPLRDGQGSEEILLADPSLPVSELANDHPERCRIDRITFGSVVDACNRLLSRSGVSRRP